MKGGTALVTGAAGFIGSHLVDRLLAERTTVRGLDNFETGMRANIEHVVEDDRFDFVEGDLRDQDTLEAVMDGVDYVFHQGAVPSVPRSVANPLLTTEANCVGTTKLLEAARSEDVEKVVVASSSSVYGSSEELPKHEGMASNPESPYALSKYWTEQLAKQYAELYGLETVGLRYFNVFGPRQDPSGDYAAVIPKFIRLMLNRKRPIIYGDGEQSRDFTFIENVLEANLLAATSSCSGEVVNVGCGQRVTVNDLVKQLNSLLGMNLSPIYDDPRPGDVKHSLANISRADKKIGYTPVVGFEVGLEKTVMWFESQFRPEGAKSHNMEGIF